MRARAHTRIAFRFGLLISIIRGHKTARLPLHRHSQPGVDARFADIAEAVEATIETIAGKRAPMNIDGATAAIYAALGFAPPLARGLFCLSRGVGAVAHGWEQMTQGGRNKGPTPPGYRWTYTGPKHDD